MDGPDNPGACDEYGSEPSVRVTRTHAAVPPTCTMTKAHSVFGRPYEDLKALAKGGLQDPAVENQIVELSLLGFDFLETLCDRIDLVSQVVGKDYIAYRLADSAPSRALRRDMFPDDRAALEEALGIFRQDLRRVDADAATRAIYAVAMTFCAANDASKRDDRKTPATYFEILVAHLFARMLGVEPHTSIPIPDFLGGPGRRLPTDYWFDLGTSRRAIHLPIKTSTRERAIQAWAHQRILDGIVGTNQLTGILVSLAETKLNRSKLEVVEICVPEQWRLYQKYIARIDRAYYLDPPAPYIALSPTVEVKTIGEAFQELESLTGGG